MNQITVIGMQTIGISVGLALADQKAQLTRTAIDRDPKRLGAAQNANAFDRYERNLSAAVNGADIVLIAAPEDELEDTFKAMASALKPGAVVIDTSPLKNAVAGWAVTHLPPANPFVSMTPALNPDSFLETSAPRADLFHKSVMVITAAEGTSSEAFHLVSDLAELLGGHPFFADPSEADGLFAAGVWLPRLTAAALVNATMPQAGWREGRKVAGRAYTFATASLDEVNEEFVPGQGALENRENVVRVLDNLIAELQTTRQFLAENDADGLARSLRIARQQHSEWLQQRGSNDYATQLNKDIREVTQGSFFKRLFGLIPNPKKPS